PTVALDRLLRPGVRLGALALLWLAAVHAPAAYAIAWAAPYAVTAVLAALALRNVLPAETGRASKLRFWRFTGPRAAASVAHLALQRVDVLLLASLAGLKPAAVYAVAGRFVVLGQLANQAILLAVQPRLAELLGGDD